MSLKRRALSTGMSVALAATLGLGGVAGTLVSPSVAQAASGIEDVVYDSYGKYYYTLGESKWWTDISLDERLTWTDGNPEATAWTVVFIRDADGVERYTLEVTSPEVVFNDNNIGSNSGNNMNYTARITNNLGESITHSLSRKSMRASVLFSSNHAGRMVGTFTHISYNPIGGDPAPLSPLSITASFRDVNTGEIYDRDFPALCDVAREQVDAIDYCESSFDFSDLANGAVYDATFSVKDANPTQNVTSVVRVYSTPLLVAEEPQILDEPGTVNDKVITGDQKFIYYQTSIADNSWRVVAVTRREGERGHSLPHGYFDEDAMLAAGWTKLSAGAYEKKGEFSLTEVVPERPGLSFAPQTQTHSLSTPATEGVDYLGTIDENTGEWSVKASPQAGYVIDEQQAVANDYRSNGDGTFTLVGINMSTAPGGSTPAPAPEPTTPTPEPTTPPVTPTPTPEPTKPAPPQEEPKRDVVVKAEAPVIKDNPGHESDEVLAPANTDAIHYTLYYVKETGVWALTATAQEGYVLSDGSKMSTQRGQLDVTPVEVPLPPTPEPTPEPTTPAPSVIEDTPTPQAPEVIQTGDVEVQNHAFSASFLVSILVTVGTLAGGLILGAKRRKS